MNELQKDNLLSGFNLELRRGVIVLCVLRKLITPTYGYNLIEILKSSNIPIESNTLYPLLRRLESQGLLESNWNTDETKPRKYYKTTPFGLEILEELKKNWDITTKNVSKLLEGE